LGEEAVSAQVRIYFGAGVSSGKASISNMFNGFKDEPLVISSGEVRKKKVSGRIAKTFTFDGAHSDMPLVYFSSPETATLRRSDTFKVLRNFDSAFHLQHFPVSVVPLLRRSALFRKLVIRMASAQQDKLSDNGRNEKSVIVRTSVQGQQKEVSCSLCSDSSFRLTGAFCASVIVMLAKGALSVSPGVYTYEDLDVNLSELEEILSEKDIRISVN